MNRFKFFYQVELNCQNEGLCANGKIFANELALILKLITCKC